MLTDLHLHTTASDGEYAPGEVAARAASAGAECIAVTDHDTLDGLDEAIRAGEALGICVIRGVELSAAEDGTFHILGYGFTAEAPALRELCAQMKERRGSRAVRLLAFLREKGVEIPLSEVEELAEGGVVGRVHFARVMVKHGFAATNRDAFDRYLDTEEFHKRVDTDKPPVRTCIEAIHASGGRVSLAHPYQIGLDNEALDRLVGELAVQGLDAVECFYPKHSREQTAFYRSLAAKYRLYVTGGSDFHGERVKPEVVIAPYELDVDWLNG